MNIVMMETVLILMAEQIFEQLKMDGYEKTIYWKEVYVNLCEEMEFKIILMKNEMMVIM